MLDIDVASGQPQIMHSVLQEFFNSGLCDIAKDPEYGECFKSNLTTENSNTNRSTNGSTSLYAKQVNTARHGIPDVYVELYQASNMTDEQIRAEIDHFHEYLNDMAMVLTFGLQSIKTYKNLYEIDGCYDINMCCRADNERMKNTTYNRLKPIIDLHERFVRENFARKHEIRRNAKLMSVVSFLVPLLMGLKRRMRIPDLNNLLPTMTGEDVHTERELPPLAVPAEFRSQLFAQPNSLSSASASASSHHSTSQKYFNLHGGVQFEIETCPVDNGCQK